MSDIKETQEDYAGVKKKKRIYSITIPFDALKKLLKRIFRK